jgi:hypothetical protein
MKIGLSYSRCVRDIVEGNVDIGDVLIIIARTDFDPRDDDQWSGIWSGYHGGSFFNTNMEWGGTDHTEEEFRAVSIKLWDSGKLHQPRKFGARPTRLPYYWLETVLVGEDLVNNVAVKQAWDQFQILAGLSNVKLNNQAY